ncbi:MAG TPA: class I SAM-dependent methyltransferase [Thermoleophilia bacterium]|nr:class I SAM-dependent methyltransferase [Thermoleophilia bacterium]
MQNVPPERWRRAQDWELAVWREANPRVPAWRAALCYILSVSRLRRRPPTGDDWNHWWAEKFDGYELVPAVIDNCVELGCGPYTNVRIIRQNRAISHLFCSDPLARYYIGFQRAWLADVYRRGEVLIDDHAIEECPFATDFFDLTLMINVVDHVRDARLCLEQVIRITRPGGMLIIGQDLTSAEDMRNDIVRNDPGHPIRVTHQQLDAAVLPRFEPALHRILSREQGRNPAAHYGTYLFIGTKR